MNNSLTIIKILAWTVLFLVVAGFVWLDGGKIPDAAPPLNTDAVPNKPAEKNTVPETSGMVTLHGGTFTMGSDTATEKDQRPAHRVKLPSFKIDVHEVTNRQFAEFVKAEDYQTAAEKNGWSYVFDPQRKAWVRQAGANWKNITGQDDLVPKTSMQNLPVVHVTWDDAAAYCKWAKKRLPTEAEWEFAAKGGLLEIKETAGNYWQGFFPRQNLNTDGFLLLAPVKSFAPNRYGLYDMQGNVWEWCGDGYSPTYYLHSPDNNPPGPPPEGMETAAVAELRLEQRYGRYTKEDLDGIENVPLRVIRGGSFLSADNTDAGYRLTARGNQPQTMSFQDVGFRCAEDAADEEIADKEQ